MSTSDNEAGAGKGPLGLWDAVSIIVGIVIGTTIYAMPQSIFYHLREQIRAPDIALLIWVLGGAIALIGAFCYAELASTFPQAGGDYYYLSKGFGPATGFLFGWAQLTVLMPASIGVMAYVFADFLQQFLRQANILSENTVLYFELPFGDPPPRLDANFAIAAQVVGVLTLLNVLGVVFGKWVQNFLTAAKVIGLGAIVVVGLLYAKPGAWAPVAGPSVNPNWPPELALAIIFILYAFGGWNDAAFVAAEVRDPKRNIPRALMISIAIIVVVYLAVNAAYINALGWDSVSQLAEDYSVPSNVIKGVPDTPERPALLKDWGGQAMQILVMISALGAANGLILTGPRVYASMGRDHGLFGWMGHWRPGRRAPFMALILQALLTVFVVGAITTEDGHKWVKQGFDYVDESLKWVSTQVQRIDDTREIPLIAIDQQWQPGMGFQNLVARTAPVFWFFFLLTGLSLFRMRERFKDVPRPFSVPLYPVIPILFCCACTWMLYRATIYVQWHALFAVVLVLLGLPFYWISRLIFGLADDEGPINYGLPRASTTPLPQPSSAPQPKHWR